LPGRGTGAMVPACTVSLVPPSAGWYSQTNVLGMPFVLLATVRG
jgi:hypothetical protein